MDFSNAPNQDMLPPVDCGELPSCLQEVIDEISCFVEPEFGVKCISEDRCSSGEWIEGVLYPRGVQL